eukprot:TRINITY_DN50023_c0_g1_i1.p1 TRINITY_DN50023_c0_g1~~TRINITY_DN50023_c0_g1_i1.p1  ORF type:complete len:736 (+),score=142.93 TRINITY_DN50023_c0_g1_i1:139-2208(+)
MAALWATSSGDGGGDTAALQALRAARSEVLRVEHAARRGALGSLTAASGWASGGSGAEASPLADEARALRSDLRRLLPLLAQQQPPGVPPAPAELHVSGLCGNRSASYRIGGWLHSARPGAPPSPAPWYRAAPELESGGEPVPPYLYYDAACDGRLAATPRWVLDDDQPAGERQPTASVADHEEPPGGGVDWDGDGACVYRGRLDWSAAVPLGAHDWQLWCAAAGWQPRRVAAVALPGAGAAAAAAATAGPRERLGRARWITECVYELRGACAVGSSWALVRPGAAAGATLPLRSCNDVLDGPVQATLMSASPAGAAWEADTPLWVGHLGNTDHIAHWIKYTLVPMVVVVVDLLGGHRPRMLGILAQGKSRSILALTSGLTHNGEPVAVAGDPAAEAAAATCHARAVFGYPMQEVDSTRRLRKHDRWYGPEAARPYFDAARRRVWTAFGLRHRPPQQPVAGAPRALRLAVTVRGGGFGVGRNLTNAAELVAEAARRGGWDPAAVDWARWPLRVQVETAQRSDVLLGVHGNSLAWQLVMPSGSVVVEVCPFGCTTTFVGVNVGDRRNSSFSGLAYIARRLSHTFVGWQANDERSSPLRTPRPDWPFAHRCRPRSAKRWMCRDLELPMPVFAVLLDTARSHVGAFTGESRWSLQPALPAALGGAPVPCVAPWCIARPPQDDTDIAPHKTWS